MKKKFQTRKTLFSFRNPKQAKKHIFPGTLGLLTFFLLFTQFQMADARTSVFTLDVKEPQNLSKLISGAARRHKLDRRLLSCLYKVESNYQVDATSTTYDYGIGQINRYMIKALKLNQRKLVTDLKYSIYQSAAILAYYQQLKRADEPRTWICRYNVGPGSLSKPGRGAACEAYLDKINACRGSQLAVL